MQVSDVLRYVICCRLIINWSKFSFDICGCCRMLWLFGQVCATMLHPDLRINSIYSTQKMSDLVATGWPNRLNMLCPKNFAICCFQCCDRLAGMCCVEIFRWLVWGFSWAHKYDVSRFSKEGNHFSNWNLIKLLWNECLSPGLVKRLWKKGNEQLVK